MANHLCNSRDTALSFLQGHFTFISPSYVRSVVWRLSDFSSFISLAPVTYFKTLWTRALYISRRYDTIHAHRAVEIGDNSLNLALSLYSCLLHTTTGTKYKLRHPDNTSLVDHPQTGLNFNLSQHNLMEKTSTIEIALFLNLPEMPLHPLWTHL